MYPEELRYTETHEWVRVGDNVAVVGLTDHAQSELGDIVYLELPAAGTEVTAGGEFGVVESVKAASDLYAPLSGEVVGVNDAATGDPALVNRDCYGEGWLVKVELKDPSELENLKTAAEYKEFIGA
ncbi:MAG: glycine cleavage system protein GcvH [candidate division Zixibacteria bacterium]|nr:glycine cleavage system protein GcvH [candidate division Zixibacteria bacterium]